MMNNQESTHFNKKEEEQEESFRDYKIFIERVRAKAKKENKDPDETVRLVLEEIITRLEALKETTEGIQAGLSESNVTSQDDWEAAVKKRENLNNNK